ncbi:hypothetical protein BDV59DRAFT_181794 [Aspergillus ambiguus]|uniref:fungal specific transcription factor domain-containing protein n=1 Tax=Aspergillus ambiguus TaxID=176160 RepID=UPI003CCD0E0E
MTMVQHYCSAYDEVTAMTTMLSQFRASKRSTVRKKFSKPPVKLACLLMDVLLYKRGRSRKSNLSTVSKRRAQESSSSQAGISSHLNEQGYTAAEKTMTPSGLPFQADIQSIFADFLDPYEVTGPDANMYQSPLSTSSIALGPFVRTYGSELEILDAYYRFIHPYFPILPQRVTCPTPDCPLEWNSFAPTTSYELCYRPRSPLSLALSCILALVPHPEDPDPSSEMSMSWRRTYSHAFAQMANLSIEADCEGGSLSKSPLTTRDPFHPSLPIDLEKILALLVLSNYEYTQRGNLTKMRYRAGQALTMALDMGIHSLGDDNTKFSEAQRRAWWMTYYCVLQGSIVSESSPSIVVNDSDFITPYPRFSADLDGWSILIQAQQALALSDQFTLDLTRCLSTGSNMPYIYHRMKGLDDTINTMLAQSKMLPVSSPPNDIDDWSECATALGIRAISRIKLFSAQIKVHQSQAFLDNSIFTRRQYDLMGNTLQGSACAAFTQSDLLWDSDYFRGDIPQSQGSSPSGSWSFSSAYQDYPTTPMTSTTQTELPFSVKYSAKVCLRAALAMSHMIQLLPGPDSLYTLVDGSPGRERNNDRFRLSTISHFPLAMPSFACCLTQGSYIMSTICYKARMAQRVSPDLEPSAHGSVAASDQLVEQLKKGLECIVATMAKHAVVFEALRAIRDEIDCAYQRAFPDA